MHTLSEWWMWIGFIIFVLILLSIDLFLLKTKGTHRVSFKEAIGWVSVWVLAALIFNLFLWWYWSNALNVAIATKKALEFLCLLNDPLFQLKVFREREEEIRKILFPLPCFRHGQINTAMSFCLRRIFLTRKVAVKEMFPVHWK